MNVERLSFLREAKNLVSMGEEENLMGCSFMQLDVSALRFLYKGTLPPMSCMDYRDPFCGEV